MNGKNWNDTLTLLSLMILADGKVYREEVETFKKAAVELKTLVNPNLMLTEHMALDWFHLHRERIVDSMSRASLTDTVAALLNNLSGMPDKKHLLTALMKVAISDGHKHDSENKILQNACKIWDLDVRLAS